jgi:hypothetical protein
MALYVHSAEAIVPQEFFQADTMPLTFLPQEGPWYASQHPDYKQFIPPASLRRMSPAIRMGMAASLSCMQRLDLEKPDAILVGSGLGCVKDTLKFLNQVIDQDEQLLNPTAFIQSTHNTVSGQIALALGCRAYNLTFTQKSLSFESALLEALLLAGEEPGRKILLGGIDEVTEESYALLEKSGCVKDAREKQSPDSHSPGALCGEGASFFVVSGVRPATDAVQVDDLMMVHSPSGPATVDKNLMEFLEKQGLTPGDITLVVSGRNGDSRQLDHYLRMERLFPQATLAAYKHLVGEWDTSSAFGLYLASRALLEGGLPGPCILRKGSGGTSRHALLVDQRKGKDYSFILLSSST